MMSSLCLDVLMDMPDNNLVSSMVYRVAMKLVPEFRRVLG